MVFNAKLVDASIQIMIGSIQMNYLLLSVRLLNSLKVGLILVSFYSVLLTIYSVNWFSLNPFEFILYTRYFIIPGIILWSIFSCRYYLKMFKNVPLNWLNINSLDEKPERINFRFIFTSTALFSVVILINGLVISVILQLVYVSNLIMFVHIFKAYLAYYFSPFLLAWILGIYIAYLVTSYSKIKQITFIITTLILFTTTFYIDYSKNLNLFANWTDQYIHPILNFGDLTDMMFQKLLIFVTITLLFLLVIKFGNYFTIIFSLALVILCIVNIPYISQNNLEQILRMNDYKLYEKLTERNDSTIQLEGDWELESIEYVAEGEIPIKVRINNIHRNEYISFSLNEQFEIEVFNAGDKKLDYTREKNLIRIDTERATEIEIQYKDTIGTSIYPILKKFTYLPFYSNWYPEKVNINHYGVDPVGYIEPNVENSSCKNAYISSEYSVNFEINNEYDCLSIISGPFHHFKLDEISWVVYIPFLTTKNNYSELVNNIGKIKKVVCTMSNSGEDCISDVIKGISIVPKSLSTSPVSVLDTVETNGYYNFNVNIFTDIGRNPITTHLSELATVQLAYGAVKNEELSIFMGQYILEILNMESQGHIDLLAVEYEIDDEEWDKYKLLNLVAKEQYLQKLLN